MAAASAVVLAEEERHVIRHVSGIAEIVDDVDAAAQFYREVLGLDVDHQPGGGYSVVKVPGVLHFGLWSRAAAAEATFGDKNAVERIPLGFAVEFEVDSVGPAADAIGERGWQIAQAPKTEPWGQASSRFFLPSGMLGGITETPWARRLSQEQQAEGEDATTE